MVAIARIRRAAAALKNEGAEVTIKALAKKADCSYEEMARFVRGINSLRDEIGLCMEGTHFGVYLRATEKIRARDELVTRKSLARELNKKARAVRQELLRHPAWVTILGILTEGERRRRVRHDTYTAIVQGIEMSGRRPSMRSIANTLGVSCNVVCRDVALDPQLRQKFTSAEIEASE